MPIFVDGGYFISSFKQPTLQVVLVLENTTFVTLIGETKDQVLRVTNNRWLSVDDEGRMYCDCT
jgi:hypothetical protein